MGLLKRKNKKKPKKGVSDYKLPELPELPDFPSVDSPPRSVDSSFKKDDSIPQLPSFPNSATGNKFSENSYKEAVTGRQEVVKEGDNADDFALPGLPEAPPSKGKMMQEPPTHEPILKPMITRPSDKVTTEPKVKEFHKKISGLSPRETMNEMMEAEEKPFNHEYEDKMRHAKSRVRSGASARDEPVFIRIDKFEESLKVFEKTREQIKEIEELVRHVKDLKSKEEEELIKWEEEIQTIKEQIGKVDRDIFSKVE